jgi:tetratricopeptide (TPR) repeat protein
LGEIDQARTLLARALKLRIDRLGAEHPFVAITHVNLGETELDASEPEAALRHFEAARDIWASAVAPDHPDHAYALTGIGRAQMDLHHPERGVEPLEHAARLRDPERVEPRLAASTRFILARAMFEAGQDRTRAREIAEQARELFMASGAGWDEAADEISVWLEAHPA